MNQQEFDDLYQKYKDGKAEPADLAVLAPYKVDNAIIMAAGMSSRFAPLSYERPKGVLPVKGEVLIERQIRQLHEVGIRDITLVVGYLKEQFYYLHDKYGIKIIENEDYARYNNTSTLIRVTEELKNTYICSSDNYFTENVFEPYVYDAYYSAIYMEEESDEWGLILDERNYITGIDHAPKGMWIMMGHVYFSKNFSEKFKELLIADYELEETRDLLWEGVYEKYIAELPMQVRKYEEGVVLEFDALSDLRAFDESYLEHTGSVIFEQICRELSCTEADIVGIKAVRKVVPDLAFSFEVNGNAYLFAYDTVSREGRLELLG